MGATVSPTVVEEGAHPPLMWVLFHYSLEMMSHGSHIMGGEGVDENHRFRGRFPWQNEVMGTEWVISLIACIFVVQFIDRLLRSNTGSRNT